MARTAAGAKPTRGWFLYPESDEVTRQWLEAQCNNSISIRLLIARYVEEFGYTDATGLPGALPEDGGKNG